MASLNTHLALFIIYGLLGLSPVEPVVRLPRLGVDCALDSYRDGSDAGVDGGAHGCSSSVSCEGYRVWVRGEGDRGLAYPRVGIGAHRARSKR